MKNDINKILRDIIEEQKSKEGTCKDCKNYIIEYDECYDNSYCKIGTKNCIEKSKFEWNEFDLRFKIRDKIEKNQDVKNIISEMINELVKDEFKEYLPCCIKIFL